jgi:hypothetical protein
VESIGVERKWARQRFLKERWARRLEKSVGAKMLARVEPEHSGAFATVHFDGIDSGKLGERLLMVLPPLGLSGGAVALLLGLFVELGVGGVFLLAVGRALEP